MIFDDSHILEASDMVFDRTIDIHFKGMPRVTRHALPHLLEHRQQ